MAKNEPEFFIRPVDKTDWIRFAANSGNNLDDDPFYQTALNTLRQFSNMDVENSEV